MDFSDYAIELEYQAILNNVLEAIITIDTAGIVLSANAAAVSMFGYSINEILGNNVSQLMPDARARAHDGYIDAYLKTGVEHVLGKGRELEGRHKSGRIFPMHLAVSDVQLPHTRYFVGVCRDISEQKETEKLKNEFVSIVSHELRTPLTSITASLGLLKGGLGGTLPEKARGLIDIAHNNAARLGRLINDILDIEKIEAGKMTFKRDILSINQLLQESVSANHGYADKYKVSLKFDPITPDIAVIADHDRSLQVLANLISNACKFSLAGSDVHISTKMTAEKTIDICVTDHGCGISPDFAARIFDKFSQADSTTARSKEGTGLGLSLSRQMAKSMGGDLSFTSTPQVQTQFCFTLPVAAPAQETALEETDNTRILIVEDDPDIARLLALLLKEQGISSHIAYSAEQAFIKLSQHHYAAMTLDLMLPGSDGTQLLAQLRQEAATKQLPVIVVSAISDKHQTDLTAAYAVLDVLPKPINEGLLMDAIGRALNIKNPHHQRPRILHIEDDSDIACLFSTLLNDEFDYKSVPTLMQARACLTHYQPDLILLDLDLPDGNGAQFFDDLQTAGMADRPVVIFSAQEQAPDTLFNRVSNYLVKSRTSNQALLDTLLHLTNNPQQTDSTSAGEKRV
jgi:PAS domain S-box-containing protein